MDITGISKSKAGLGLQFEVASKDRLQVGQRFFMRPKVSICITLCVCCFYLFFFEKGWIWRDDNKKYCIIFKK